MRQRARRRRALSLRRCPATMMSLCSQAACNDIIKFGSTLAGAPAAPCGRFVKGARVTAVDAVMLGFLHQILGSWLPAPL